jgi:hypothetical protein
MYDLVNAEKARSPQPNYIFTEYCGKIVGYEEILDPREWLHVGHIPTPTTRAGWFCYHVTHGLWMRYPFFKVLMYALRNCNPRRYILPDDFEMWENCGGIV